MVAKARISLLLIPILFAGCAVWSHPSEEQWSDSFRLPAPPMAPDGFGLEIAQVKVDEAEFPELEVWRQIDEQHLPVEIRRKLADNGWRCGRIGGPLPGRLRELLDQAQQDRVVDEDNGQFNLDSRIVMNRIRMRPGKEKEIQVGPSQDRLNVLTSSQGAVTGKTVNEAQCVLLMKSQTRGDDGVRLSFQPQIIHGPLRQTWTAGDGGWRIAPKRDRAEFPDAEFEAGLAPGETLLLTCTAEAKSIGRHFFASEQKTRRLLLIRLSHTQENAVFAPEAEERAPIATPTE